MVSSDLCGVCITGGIAQSLLGMRITRNQKRHRSLVNEYEVRGLATPKLVLILLCLPSASQSHRAAVNADASCIKSSTLAGDVEACESEYGARAAMVTATDATDAAAVRALALRRVIGMADEGVVGLARGRGAGSGGWGGARD
eukprot:2700664-Pleurochrysis_carterae.AAC.6